MNDRQLTSLLRMAAEADQLAGDDARLPAAIVIAGMSAVPPARLARRGRFWGTASAAAAAIIGLAYVSIIGIAGPSSHERIASASPTRASRPIGPTVDPVEPRLALASASIENSVPTRNMMMAVFSDECGERSCVVTHDRDDLSGRDPTKMSDEELLDLAMGDRCVPAAEQVVVIGLSGPETALPRNDAEAHTLAACFGSAPGFGQSPTAFLACVPPGVSVVTTNLSLSAPPR